MAVLWLGAAGVMMLISATLPFKLPNWAARQVGIVNPTDLVLLLAALFLIGLVFRLSVGMAHMSERQTARYRKSGCLLLSRALSQEEFLLRRPNRRPGAGGP